MISDAIHEAIREIERYQREWPDNYEECRDHIEIVKDVMSSLQNILDAPPGASRLSAFDALSEDQKQWWRACCEANVTRWVERLRLLGPVPANELAEKLAGAVERQDSLMNERRGREEDGSDEDEVRRELFQVACECWNDGATTTACDALQDILSDNPHLAGELVSPMIEYSEFWLEQIARAAFGLPSDHTEDYDDLLSEGKRALAGERPVTDAGQDAEREETTPRRAQP